MASITFSGPSSPFSENGVAVGLGDAVAFDSNGLQAGLSGDQLVVSISSGALPSDRLTLGGSGITLDGRRILVANTEVATFRGGLSGQPLTISLNSSATSATVEALLQAIRFDNLAENLPTSATRQISVQLLDTGGSAPVAVEAAPVSLTVNGLADAPKLYSTQILYDARTNLLPTNNAAAPGGPWLSYQDLTKIQDDVEIRNNTLNLDLVGLPLLGGEASLSESPGAATLISDADAYAGISNYKLFAEITSSNPFAPAALADLELVNSLFPTLDRNEGYVLSFVATVQDAPRISGADKDGDGVDDRAGFSVVLLSEDKKGIELGFWNDRIWAQNDGSTQSDPSLEPDSDPADFTRTFFTQGEFVEFVTTQNYQYDLVIQGDAYTLFADSEPILTGPLRDYSAFPNRVEEVDNPLFPGTTVSVTAPDPYEKSNFIFLGDNGPLASATVDLGSVSISTADSTPQLTVANGQIQTFQGFNIQLPDAPEELVTVTLTDRDRGGTFAAVGDGTLAVTSASLGDGSSRLQLNGPLKAINAYLADPTQLAYQPAVNFSGTVPLEVSFNLPFTTDIGAVSSDFNLDGLSDILLRNAVSGDNLVRFMDGLTTVRDGVIGRQIPDVNWRFDALGDFNSDQKADIVLRNYNGSGQILLWNMDGANILSETLVGRLVPDPNWEVAGTGDFNGDNQTDIVLRNNVSDQNLIWYMNGTDIISEGLVGRAIGDPFWQISGTGDFNGDGQTDIILRHQSPAGLGQNLVWLMNGSDILQEVSIGRDIPDVNWEIAGSTDFNSDGQSDLLLRNYSTGDNLAWIMNGTGIVSEVPLLSVPDTQWRALV